MRAFRCLLLFALISLTLGLSPLKEMEGERKDFLKDLSANIPDRNLDITIFERKYEDVIKKHLNFCRKKNLDFYDYLLIGNPGIGDFDVKELKKNCLLSLRNWQINVEKKFFKLRREMLRDLLNSELEQLQLMESKKINKIIKDYSSID